MPRMSQERPDGEALQYIQAMLGQLAAMARAERCEMLTYLIEMAYVEAGDIVCGARPPSLREERSRAVDEEGHSAS
ncbi:hypothetical protein [Chelativorans sp. M5D2P16]|uniref:hypothetical protein n=1 Tax=Chelativorans sp. M5D2P16 TaxID=3095678 RepID=UPI002ACA4B0D|nr:hypothetical protein [Chelativorans sp. M5D2P16]MDZ5696372.1 hypothetical protein [Chelativorans sp. M5D2P16]